MKERSQFRFLTNNTLGMKNSQGGIHDINTWEQGVFFLPSSFFSFHREEVRLATRTSHQNKWIILHVSFPDQTQ
jgi:hypothetical protein